MRVSNSPLGRIDGRVDVTDRTIAQATDHRIILFASDIRMHFAQQFERLVQCPGRLAASSTPT